MTTKDLLNNQYSFNNQDLLVGLPDAVCEIINANRGTTSFKAGQSIFTEGQKPEGVYRVRKGKVKKITHTNFGTQHIFYICKETEFLVTTLF
jgi:CRP-like cAMP-binding protein